MLREMYTIYGRSTLGYLWTTLEPALGVIAMTLIFFPSLHTPRPWHQLSIVLCLGGTAVHGLYAEFEQTCGIAQVFKQAAVLSERHLCGFDDCARPVTCTRVFRSGNGSGKSWTGRCSSPPASCSPLRPLCGPIATDCGGTPWCMWRGRCAAITTTSSTSELT